MILTFLSGVAAGIAALGFLAWLVAGRGEKRGQN